MSETLNRAIDLCEPGTISAMPVAAQHRSNGSRADERGIAATALPERRPRLACVSPLPPEPSGISSYTAELIPFLSEHYRIEVIVNQENVSGIQLGAGIPVRSVRWFKENWRSFDRVLYHFGNSPFHAHMFGLLQQIPGTVVLHDFYLSGIVEYLDNRRGTRGVLSWEIFHAHGYQALARLLNGEDRSIIVRDYPCSHQVFRNADGVIVHSQHARELARRWYGPQVEPHLRIIPHLRVPVEATARDSARKSLGIPADAFIVCTYGQVNANKQAIELLYAWLASSMSHDTSCMLVYAGANDPGAYGRAFSEAIPATSRVLVTGWLDERKYRLWLQAADAAVQLRTDSRGESSGALLDAMNHGLPVIINSHGSMAEIPEGPVMKVPDACSRQELASALNALFSDKSLRTRYGCDALDYLRREHDPQDVAARYAKAIESFHAASVSTGQNGNGQASANKAAVTRSVPSPARSRQLFVDISALVHNDLKTGIQRVVRGIVKSLIDAPPDGFRIEPVYATLDQPYRYARSRTLEWLGCQQDNLFYDDYIEVHQGDILFVPDLNTDVVVCHRETYQAMRQKNARVVFLVHDLLPVFLPQYFLQGTKKNFEAYLEVIASSADAAIGVTRTVALDIDQWVRQNKAPGTRHLAIGWNHHGADIDASIPSLGLPEGFDEQLQELTSRPTFLMVGTVEPRKGHFQALRACELLWSRGVELNLVIVGKHGWMVDELAAALNEHRELGHRLFWYQGISDEALLRIYQLADCVLMASEGEGFGLPLIEAAQHQRPILARDIPVFREIGGEHASYFAGFEPEPLAAAMGEWINNAGHGAVPQSVNLPWSTWQESTRQLLDMLADANHPQWLPPGSVVRA